MDILNRLRSWYRKNHSFAWVDKDSEWREYRLNWRKEHAVSVTIDKCKLQVHPDTGNHRVHRQSLVSMKETYDKFDGDGYLVFDDNSSPIAPKTESDAVEGTAESDVSTINVKIRPEDIDGSTDTN